MFNVVNSPRVLAIAALGSLQDLTFGADPDIKECRLLVFAKSICNNDQPCALLAPLFSADVLGDGMAFNVAAYCTY